MSQKDRIIEQAMEMFVSQGIKAVRMDDIAQQLCVSKRTLYELFGDKEELLFQSMCCYFDQCEAAHSKLTENAENVLQAMFLVLTEEMNNSEATHRMMTNLQKFYPTTYDRLLTEGREKHRKSMRLCLEAGIAQGLFVRDLNIELSLSVLYYTASALFCQRGGVVLPEGMSENEAYLQIVACFFRGIATVKGIGLIDEYRAQHTITKDK